MENRAPLTRSIYRNVIAFWLFHSTAFVLLSVAFGFFPLLLLPYFGLSLGVCALLLGVLLYARQHFILLETKQELSRVNLPNQLTMFRITSLPAILFLFIASRSHPVAIPLIVYMALSFLTDTFDGIISRRTHQVTRIGQYLDSMGDYAVLIGVAIAFVSFQFIPLWFFLVVLVRFMTQWIAMGALFLLQKGSVEPKASLLGKISVACSMAIFGLGLLQLFPWYPQIAAPMFWLEVAVSLVLAASLVEKLRMFHDDLKRVRGRGIPDAPA